METVVQNVWSKSKLLVKSGIIAVIILLLQIPNFYVTDLIKEREARQKEAIAEVSGKWAGRQNLIGPILVVPYWQTNNDTAGRITRVKQLALFLPDELKIDATITPQEKHRGIYKVMLYESQVKLNGVFTAVQPQKLGIAPEEVLWNEAYVRMNVSDNRGLNDELKLKLNDSLYALQASGPQSDGLQVPIVLDAASATQPLRFSTALQLNGSEQILFTPVGKVTTVNLQSAWPHPSFTGSVLPQTSAIANNGFSATWKSRSFTQNFPQHWKASINSAADATTAQLSQSAFGAELFVPVNGYQKTMRSIKYSFLCLVLTFAAFFLIELSHRKSAHPFHYGLIGLALILFYTLLLSISEYISFNASYVIASVATIGLIAWFVRSLLQSGKLTLLLSFILVLLYGYVFTILQLQDYSLLLGSIGLFLTLAVVMHFSKKFQW